MHVKDILEQPRTKRRDQAHEASVIVCCTKFPQRKENHHVKCTELVLQQGGLFGSPPPPDSDVSPSPGVKPLTPEELQQFVLERKRLNRKRRVSVCVFCKNNGEREEVFISHTLKVSTDRCPCWAILTQALLHSHSRQDGISFRFQSYQIHFRRGFLSTQETHIRFRTGILHEMTRAMVCDCVTFCGTNRGTTGRTKPCTSCHGPRSPCTDI